MVPDGKNKTMYQGTKKLTVWQRMKEKSVLESRNQSVELHMYRELKHCLLDMASIPLKEDPKTEILRCEPLFSEYEYGIDY